MSYKSNVSSRVSNALLSKLNKVREKIKKDNDIYISQEHKNVCYHYHKYQELLSKVQTTNKTIFFDYKYDNIIVSKEIKILENHIANNIDKYDASNFKPVSVNYTMSYNNYNHKFINNINKYFNPDYINEYIKEQDDFIQSLSFRELITLRHINMNTNYFIYLYLEKKLTLELFKSAYLQIMGENKCDLLFYYQFKDYFKKNDFRNIYSDDIEIFLGNIFKNLSFFTPEILYEVVGAYYNEINEIFKKAPKTKEVIYLYYCSMKSNNISLEIAKSKRKDGIYKSNKNFLYGGVIPEEIILKMNKDTQILYEIKVEKGLPLILNNIITPTEKKNINFILPINVNLYIDYVSKNITYYKNKKNICDFKKLGSSYYTDITMTSLIYYDMKTASKRTSSYLSVSKSLLGKLEKVRKKIKEDNDIYISKEHQEVCEHYHKYLEYKDQIIMKKNSLIIKYMNHTPVTSLEHHKVIDNYLENKPNDDFKEVSYKIEMDYNQFNHKFINGVERIFNQSDIDEFLNDQNDFFKSLNTREIYNLKNYTFMGDKIIVEFITNLFSIDLLYIDYSYSTLFFFQFHDYFSLNPIYNDTPVNTSNSHDFINFLKLNYKSFSSDIYNYVISSYIDELNKIFKKAPKAKEVMYVYRGVKDNYISKEVSRNKSRGLFISNRFTSTSLFVSSAKGFMRDDDNSVLYEIKIEKGCPLIFLEGISLAKGEYEILLPMNSKFYIDYAVKKGFFYTNPNVICDIKTGNRNGEEIIITSLVYIP